MGDLGSVKNIERHPDIKTLFAINPVILEKVQTSMSRRGFDEEHPIILGDIKGEANVCVVDGHTRLSAAVNLGLTEIPVVIKAFDSLLDAVHYAVQAQANRRNLTDGELLRVIETVDRLKERGGGRDVETGKYSERPKASDEAKGDGKSASQTAKTVGTSRAKVEKARAINKDADEETIAAVTSGEKSLNKAYQETQEKKKHVGGESAKHKFNDTNDMVEWANWTWNPITGCKHGCSYCYARDTYNRFKKPEDNAFEEPKFHEYRLQGPYNTKIPPNRIDDPKITLVFVGSMTDMFGNWVPKDQIQKVLDVCEKTPQWTYILLTKNPKRYAQFKFPANCWAGATVDTQARVEDARLGLTPCDAPIRFVSCEPLKGPIIFPENMPLDWLIIGGQSESSGEPAFQPEWEWVESLLTQAKKLNTEVYFKPNLTVRPKQYPAMK
ncbi:MAG: DUF5131 family protein [Desulfomonile sp.]